MSLTTQLTEQIAAPIPAERRKSGNRGLHPLYATNLSSWLTVLRRYGDRISGSQRVRMSLITLMSLLGTPVRCYEAFRVQSRIDKFEMLPPVFILGHWRSGTTNFQNHMLQNPQFGYVSLLHCLSPPYFVAMEKFVRRFMSGRLPQIRAMDRVPIGLDEPMSEDFAMACLSEFTHYHRYFFPESNDEILRRTIFFEGVSQREIDRWHRSYDGLLRKVALAMGGKRLVLKNPPNTGRIRELVKYYPNAKFVHVYRNPYEVIVSTLKLMHKFLERFSFQRYAQQQIEENVLRDYARIMQRFFEDEHLLPEENYISVSHEDVVEDAIGTLQRVYEKLQLHGFQQMQARLEAYVESISDYQNNTYDFNDDLILNIRKYCGFALDRWGYQPPIVQQFK